MSLVYDANVILSMFRIIATQYSSIIDDEAMKCINIAYQIVKQEDFINNQSDYNLALVYVAADLIFFSENSNGIISDKSIADIKISYFEFKGRSPFFNRYQSLLMENGAVPFMISE